MKSVVCPQRSIVYRENKHLRKQLGMKTDRTQKAISKVISVVSPSTAPAPTPAAPLMSAPPHGVGWQRYLTELAHFAVGIGKESKEAKSIETINNGLRHAASGAATPEVMHTLLNPETLLAMSDDPRSQVRKLTRNVIGSFLNIGSTECGAVLASAFESATADGAKLEKRILRGLEKRDATFRSEALTRALEAMSAANYPDAARRMAFKTALPYKSEVLAYLNEGTPRPRLTQSAGIGIAQWLTETLDPAIATPQEQIDTAAFVLPLSMSISDAKRSADIVNALIAKLPVPANGTQGVIAGALMKLPQDLREATMIRMLERPEAVGTSWLSDMLDPASATPQEQIDTAAFVLPLVMSIPDAKQSADVVNALIAKLPVPANGTQGVIAAALMKLPQDLRQATIAGMLEGAKATGESPPAVVAQGLARAIVENYQTSATGVSSLHQCTFAIAALLSSLDGKDWKAYRAVFDATREFMNELDKQIEKSGKQSNAGGQTVESSESEIAQCHAAKRALIESIGNDAMTALSPVGPPVAAAGKAIAPAKLQATNERNAALLELRKDVAALVVRNDEILLPCAEQRLPALRAEIGEALTAQATAWMNKTAGAQMLNWTHVLQSDDLSSSIAVSPVELLGTGGNGSAYLYSTSSPALPNLVIKVPPLTFETTPEDQHLYELTLQHEFNIYKDLHPGRDRDQSRLCWSYGKLTIKHPVTGTDCLALGLETIDGEDMHDLRPELSFEASNRHLQHELFGIYQYEQRAMLEASAELSKAGYMHSDLKPNNVMVKRDGSVKIIDLGLAVQLGAPKKSPLGTPGFRGGEAHGGYNINGTQAYIPHATSDHYFATVTTLDGLENLAVTREYVDPYTSLTIYETGDALSIDESGTAYRSPGKFLSLRNNAKDTQKEQKEPKGYPVGAFEEYYTRTLTENPNRRPRLQEALDMPYLSDPIVTDDEARNMLARAVEQYQRRGSQGKATVQKFDYLPDRKQRLTAPRILPEQPGSDKPIPKNAFSAAWLKTQPGIAIPLAQKKLSRGIQIRNDSAVMISLEYALRSLHATIGRRENITAFAQYLDKVSAHFQTTDFLENGIAQNPYDVQQAAAELQKSLVTLLESCSNDPRAYDVLKAFSSIVTISSKVAEKYNNFGIDADPFESLGDDVDCALQHLAKRIRDITNEITGKYKNPPAVLATRPGINSLARKLMKTPVIKSGLKSAPPLPGLADRWAGWSNADGTTSTAVDIDAEIAARAQISALGGFGVEILDNERAALKEWQDDIRSAHDELLGDLKKYWGAGKVTQQATGGEAKLTGVGKIPNSPLGGEPLSHTEYRMRIWLAALDRLVHVLEALEVEEHANASGDVESKKAVAKPTGGGTLAMLETRADRFAKGRIAVQTMLAKHVNDPKKKSTYYAIETTGVGEHEETKPAADAVGVTDGKELPRFNMLEDANGGKPLEAGDRNTGVTSDSGKVTAGDWAMQTSK
jgi:serine/threonine protein kinase